MSSSGFSCDPSEASEPDDSEVANSDISGESLHLSELDMEHSPNLSNSSSDRAPVMLSEVSQKTHPDNAIAYSIPIIDFSHEQASALSRSSDKQDITTLAFQLGNAIEVRSNIGIDELRLLDAELQACYDLMSNHRTRNETRFQSKVDKGGIQTTSSQRQWEE